MDVGQEGKVQGGTQGEEIGWLAATHGRSQKMCACT